VFVGDRLEPTGGRRCQCAKRTSCVDGPRLDTGVTVSVGGMSHNRWIEMTERNPEHSSWYVERFRSMVAAGDDLGGESRFGDAMVARRSRVLDAGCGPGRVGSHLARVGHEVVGVDIDPVLIAAAEHDHPGPTWLVADLAELDLRAMGIEEGFDLVVCAGNVMTFLDPDTRQPVLDRLAAHLRDDGRIVIGFGSGRDYSFAEFFEDVAQVGLVAEVLLSAWDIRPFTAESDFLVAVLSRSASTT
jgi:SAM-dependent methyltransferase